MRPLISPLGPTFLAACVALVGCASTQPVAYTGLASAAQLRPNADDKSGHTPYRTAAQTDWHKYASAVVAPVVVYRGPDAQFEDTSDADKVALAAYIKDEFTRKLNARFEIVDSPRAGTILVKVTLTGAKTTTRFLSTATRFDLVGAPYNIVQAVRGKEGSFTGSVSYAVEIFDATSNALLDAYVTKQYPSPMNIKASLGALDASKAGIRNGADDLLAHLR